MKCIEKYLQSIEIKFNPLRLDVNLDKRLVAMLKQGAHNKKRKNEKDSQAFRHGDSYIKVGADEKSNLTSLTIFFNESRSSDSNKRRTIVHKITPAATENETRATSIGFHMKRGIAEKSSQDFSSGSALV